MTSLKFNILSLLAIIALLQFQTAAASRYHRHCRRVQPYTCKRPAVAKLRLKSYLGTWFTIFHNQNVGRLFGKRCVTAYYTPRSRNRNKFKILNCVTPWHSHRPRCVRARGYKRRGFGKAGRLRVYYKTARATGNYHVAALLGRKEYGYYAAAVYFCKVKKGRVIPSWVILSRNPYRPYRTLRLLKWKLICMGYPIYKERFFRIRHGRGCTYFFSGKGFDARS